MLLLVGPTIGIFLNVLIYLPLTLWLIRNPKRVNTDRKPSAASMTSFRDLFATIRQISNIPIVFSMSLLAGAERRSLAGGDDRAVFLGETVGCARAG